MPRTAASPIRIAANEKSPRAADSVNPRLRANPGFVRALTLDGRPYVMQEVEPYSQFWLSERDSLLLAFFSRRGGACLDDVARACLQLQSTGKGARTEAEQARERRRIERTVADMLDAGVLLRSTDDTSRYTQRIVADYVAHRPFPAPLAAAVVRDGGVESATRVLDLAGGPGDLALALARHSKHVALMELSRGFLAAARRRARQAGLALRTLHDSCNRLPQLAESYDVITISQALHWLDDVAVCRGVCRVLQSGGSFFVIHTAIDLADAHPLSYLLGHDSILGAKRRRPFVEEMQSLLRRLALLFEALDAPDVDRVDPDHVVAGPGWQRIGFAGARFIDQQRPFDAGYARGFLTPQHIAITGQDEATFWADLQARCAAVSDRAAWLGTHRWGVLHFRRGAAASLDLSGCGAQAIGYEPAR